MRIANEPPDLTAGLTAPLLMSERDWHDLIRSLHTDALLRMLCAGDWMSVEPRTGEVLMEEVYPEITQWPTRSLANLMLLTHGRNVESYVQESIAKFQEQFAPDLAGMDTVNSLALTYGIFSDEKHLLGIRWRAILTKDFGVVVRGMEHRIL